MQAKFLGVILWGMCCAYPIAAVAGPVSCDVTFGITDIVPVGAIEFVAKIDASLRDFATDAMPLSCRPEISEASVSASRGCVSPVLGCETDDAGAVSVLVNRPNGFVGPADLATCEFHGVKEPSLESFEIALVTLVLPAGVASRESPAVTVTAIDCGTGTAAVGTGAVTTALLPSLPEPSSPAAKRAMVDIRVESAETLGALQVELPYDELPGHFVGSGASVECHLNPQINGVASFHNCDGADAPGSCAQSKVLRAAIFSIDGLDLMEPLFSCLYESEETMPRPELFTVQPVELATPRAQSLNANTAVRLYVSQITAR